MYVMYRMLANCLLYFRLKNNKFISAIQIHVYAHEILCRRALGGDANQPHKTGLKGVVHFEIIFWCVLAYLKGIQDVCVFVSSVFSILIFLVKESYNGGLWSPPQRACTEKSKLNMI